MTLSLRSPALRPIPFFLAMAFLLRPRAPESDTEAPSRAAALAEALKATGLTVSSKEVVWLHEDGRLPFVTRDARAVVRAAAAENPPALYLVDTRLSPEGVLLAHDVPHKLTRSQGIEETMPVVSGKRLATALLESGAFISVQIVDLEREPAQQGPRWTSLARAQNSVTNLQETGQMAGMGRRMFRLVPPVARVALAFEGHDLVVRAEGKEARIPEVLPASGLDVGTDWLRPEPSEKGQLGNLVTWAVDRVRSSSFVGDDNMQKVKALAFGALDTANRAKASVSEGNTASDIKQDMGNVGSPGAPPAFTDPETGWPPPPIPPFFTKNPIPGEGEWILLDKDPFIRVNPGQAAAFATTFVRTDRERTYTRIYVTVWDPRQVALHPVAGTVEPAGADGAAGPGVIPRSGQTLGRLVAATNGGFQALHGEFGMMVDGHVYLPPKPFAATIATLRDGSTGFGTWPEDTTTIPPEITGYRQNLTPLVRDQQLNPYKRTWWGGTPPGWEDRIHTTRSGMCLTKEHFVAYFYGNDIDADVLGQAMVQARCELGLHLDMNPGHTGLEFYRADPEAQYKPLERPLQRDWEGEGMVGDSGWKFRSRRMIRGMGLMNFPRYIQRESRDFFYLTLRPVLPGPEVPPLVAPGAAGEGIWRLKGLPQHGFPPALATTLLRSDLNRAEARLRVLAVDPRAVTLAGESRAVAGAPVVLTMTTSARARPGETSLYVGGGGFALSANAVPGAVALFSGLSAGSESAAAVGVRDADGALIYVEPESEGREPGAIFESALARAGCQKTLLLDKSLNALLGGTTTLGGIPGRSGSGTEIRFVRADAPGGRTLFADTPIVPFAQWQPLQMKRIRYFKKPKDE